MIGILEGISSRLNCMCKRRETRQTKVLGTPQLLGVEGCVVPVEQCLGRRAGGRSG